MRPHMVYINLMSDSYEHWSRQSMEEQTTIEEISLLLPKEKRQILT